MAETNRAWSLLAFGDDRQYGGNAGYADDIRKSYQFDESVPNHKRIQGGDLVLLRDRRRLVGAGIVDSISSMDGLKERLRCPTCKSTAIKKRKNVKPEYRCQDGHTFDSPVVETFPSKLFVATYGNSFVDATGELPASVIKSAALRPSDQLSIEELDIGRIEAPPVKVCPGAEALLTRFLSTRLPDALPNSAAVAPADFTLSLSGSRDLVLRSIVARRGQASFRSGLARRYGRACMVTGCTLFEIVEAAHIWPYRGAGDNHLDNGLLLRADVHTLFDLNLVAVNPQRLTMKFHPRVIADGYAQFEGVSVRVTKQHSPATEPLDHRWMRISAHRGRHFRLIVDGISA